MTNPIIDDTQRSLWEHEPDLDEEDRQEWEEARRQEELEDRQPREDDIAKLYDIIDELNQGREKADGEE